MFSDLRGFSFLWYSLGMKKIITCRECLRDKTECGRGLCSGCYGRLDREGRLEKIPANRKHSINQSTVIRGLGECKNCGEVEVRLKKGRWVCREGVREQRKESQTTGIPHRSYLENKKHPRAILSKWVDSQYLIQSGRCGVCQESRDKKDLFVDHDHSTPCGHDVRWYCLECVRELLCSRCNSGLGFFREDIKILDGAVAYIKRHSKGRN